MNPRVILYVALILAVCDRIHWVEPPQQLPLVHADYPVCVNVNPGPLEKGRSVPLYPRRKDVA